VGEPAGDPVGEPAGDPVDEPAGDPVDENAAPAAADPISNMTRRMK
jgi:hypothetical protein